MGYLCILTFCSFFCMQPVDCCLEPKHVAGWGESVVTQYI